MNKPCPHCDEEVEVTREGRCPNAGCAAKLVPDAWIDGLVEKMGPPIGGLTSHATGQRHPSTGKSQPAPTAEGAVHKAKPQPPPKPEPDKKCYNCDEMVVSTDKGRCPYCTGRV